MSIECKGAKRGVGGGKRKKSPKKGDDVWSVRWLLISLNPVGGPSLPRHLTLTMASDAASRRDEDGRLLSSFVVMYNANHIFSQRFALSANRRDTSTRTCDF